MQYIGFDLGDGESAVATFAQGSGIEPVVRPIAGSRSLLSAVGMQDGAIVVGEQAYTSSLAENLSVRFKSRFTDDPRAAETVALFVRGVLRSLRDDGVFSDEDRFVVGCPAGWNAATRARYRDVLVRAGLHDPRVISESRAAFLYAKYAKTVALDLDILRQSALVVDIGSSTLDFAYIVDGRETGVGTFGDTHLGGGLLDAEILRRAVARSRDHAAIERVFTQSRSWYSYCEIEARRLKEEYYTQAAQTPDASVKKQLRICYDGTQKLPLQMDAHEAEAIVSEPMEVLQGQSFAQSLYQTLVNARQITQDEPPKLLLLTGGASRMPFFQEQCREVFDGAVVVVCSEPEFSIAKGLAYAGWVDDNLRAFRAAIRAEVTDARVGAVAQDAFAELVPGVVDVLCPLIVEEAAIPVALQWKKGEIETLREMNNRIQRRAERVLASPMAEQALAPVLENWLAQLTPSLQAMVDPICDRYHVPRDEMRLVLMQTGETGDLRFGAKQLLGFSLIGILVGVALSVLVALLCGGGGIALIATGPLGLLAGAAVGAVVAALGWPAVTEMLLGAHLPRMMRLVNVEARLRSETTQRTLRDSLFRELGGRNSEFSQKLVSAFTDAFQKYLARIAQAAEVPIQ